MILETNSKRARHAMRNEKRILRVSPKHSPVDRNKQSKFLFYYRWKCIKSNQNEENKYVYTLTRYPSEKIIIAESGYFSYVDAIPFTNIKIEDDSE